MNLRLVGVVLCVALFGCGKKGVGETCAEPSECNAPATCILSGSSSITDGKPTCDETKKLCSKTCNVDADCSSLGAGHICITDCFQGSCLPGSRR